MATPQIPPRPVRPAAPSAPAAESEAAPQIPQIPPRPAGRRIERSVSPGRDRYAPSPLNAPFSPKTATPSNNSPYSNAGKNTSGSNLDLPHRPPSVSLPSIGQEGNEYEGYSDHEPLSRTVSAAEGTQTSHVGTDLPLHAPKPGLSQSQARASVQGVTHSDNSVPSSPAGRRLSAQLDEPSFRPLRSRASLQLRSPSAASTERPGSAQAEHHGIPEIGLQVPMYKNAGDVQAPSPAPFAAQETGRSRHHNRTRSARDSSNPPDSYGRHGHGVMSTAKFEKDWYAKHPEALAQEGHYSPALNGYKREYVLSSEELNKLVQGSAGAGFGTKPDINGLPDEQIGYMASEQYASRMSSRPTSSYGQIASPGAHQTQFVSPLQKPETPAGAHLGMPELSRVQTNESEIIHIDAPEQHWSKVTGEGTAVPDVDLGPHGGNTAERGGFIDEKGYGVPILASDELRPDSVWQKPAVSPTPPDHDRQGNADLKAHFGSRPSSRPGSRPGSIHGIANLSRFDSHDDHGVHTPLDDVEEYEPLFDDDDKVQKPVTEAQRFKHRPDMRHRFPSQDIWEDSPDSARLETYVDTPEAEEQEPIAPQATSTFEPPEVEQARKGEVSEAERNLLIPKEQRLAQSDFKPRIRQDLRRPNVQRFPSSDVWEDSPDSAQLETTVGETEDEEEENAADRAGAVVATTTDRGQLDGATPREGATAGGPIIPQRPLLPLKHKSSEPKVHSHLSEVVSAGGDGNELPVAEIQRSPLETRKPPSIPDRPKPHVPARPVRSDAASPEDPSAVKTKPPVPARPVGGKIAALQAGFMSDLNNRLKLGPQAPPKPVESESSADELQENKAPLEDARKGRARGPARRKPATTAAPEPAPAGKRVPKLSFAKPVTVWHISPKGSLDVVYETPEPSLEDVAHSTITEKAVDSSDDSPVPTKSAEAPSLTAPTSGPEDLPGAFPETPAAETNELSINPLPASAGPGNPISLPAGESLPPTTQSMHNAVTTSKAAYESSGAGTDPPAQSTSTSTATGTETDVQTGIKHIEINPDTPGAQKLTVIESGNAETGEDVVVQHDQPKDDEGRQREDLA